MTVYTAETKIRTTTMKLCFAKCACSRQEHSLIFEYDAEDDEVVAYVYLDQYLPWWRRVWTAIRYVFQRSERWGHYDTTVWTREMFTKLGEWMLSHKEEKHERT